VAQSKLYWWQLHTGSQNEATNWKEIYVLLCLLRFFFLPRGLNYLCKTTSSTLYPKF